jgi:hypothetical protein
MKDPFPTFLDSVDSLSVEEMFRPLPPNRRGEIIAWSSAVVVGLVSGALFWQGRQISSLGIFLFIFFSLSALLISFGNWMESHTLIRLSSEQVVYHSPVRKVTLALDDVRELWVSSAGRGWRIAVRGEGGFFTYRSAARLGGRLNQAIYIGIEHGDRLAGLIRSMAQLSPPILEGEAWLCRKEL